MPKAKTRIERKGREQWNKFAGAILVWRQQKAHLFEAVPETGPKELRVAYERLKRAFEAQKAVLEAIEPKPMIKIGLDRISNS